MTRPPTTSTPDIARLADEAARGCVVPVDAACVLGRAWQDLDSRLRALSAAWDALRDRVVTVADEAFGPFPVQTADEALTAIERGCFEARRDREAERARIEPHREVLRRLLDAKLLALHSPCALDRDPAAVAALRAVLGVVDV